MAQYISQPRLEGPIWLEPRDISFLRNLIAETETLVKSLENRIKQADEDPITELIHEKDAKTVELASLRNILSPIRRIPLEVLSEIFELSCFPVDGTFTVYYNIMRYISRISLVCVAWREAVLSTPKLWTKICINNNRNYPQVERIKEWLIRSKGLPLKLHISIHYPFKSQMDCILEFCDQIAVIDVSLGSSSLAHDALISLFRLSHTSFPLLEKLSLHFGNSVDTEYLWRILPQRIEAFFGAPRLQHLSIIDKSYVSMLAKLMLPLEQLTWLEIEVWSSAKFDLNIYPETLHLCKDLITLKLNSFRQLGFDSDFSVCLPSLKFLDISCQDVLSHRFTFLHGLTTPVLEGLVLRYCGQDIHDLCSDVVSFQNRSATRLSSLRLRCDPRYRNPIADDFFPILAAFPTVQSFSVDPGWQKYDIDDLIQAMIYTKRKPILFPQLMSLDISFSERLKADSVISLIRSRWWSDSMVSEMSDDIGVARLQKITLSEGISDSILRRDDFNFPTLIVDLKYNPLLRYY